MNKKGFAISIVMYSIVFLIVTILYIILGIVRNRYVINERLRDQVMMQLNREEALVGPEETVVGNCYWVEDSTQFGPNMCYYSSVPSNPKEGDYYVEFLEDKYAYVANYTCDGINVGYNITSDYSYDSETIAQAACESNKPNCGGISSAECVINTYHKCKTFKYICN